MEQAIGKSHKLSMVNRKGLGLTGVTDVISFDMNEVLLESTQGMLTIKGEDLKVSRVQLEKGEVDVEGTVDSIAYSEISSYAKKGQSLLKRMFG